MGEILIKSIGAFIAIYGFGAVLHVPKRFLVWAGADGALGWFVYLTAEVLTGENMLISTFLGAVAISVCGHFLARYFKTPVTMFVIPANLTLVPGAGMYRIVYYTLYSEKELSSYYFQQTLQAAGVIAAAIFLVNILLGNYMSGAKNRKEKKC